MYQQSHLPAPVSTTLSRKESLRLLDEVSFGRIAFVSRAAPAIRLVSHAMDGEGLLVGLPYEEEINALLSHPSLVVYQADLLDAATRLGWSIVLSGRAGLVEDPGEVRRALRRLQPWPGRQVEVVARIQPELVTGFRCQDAVAR